MPRMRSMDGGGIQAQCLEEAGVCERTSFQHRRNPNQTWPFLFSYKEEEVLINRAARQTRAEAARVVGDALM